MAENDRRRKLKGESMALDMLHILIGIAVVIMAVISFINPEEYMSLFPVIFFLAAVLNLVTGRYRMKKSMRNKGRKVSAAIQMICGAGLVIMAVMSAVSVWGGR